MVVRRTSKSSAVTLAIIDEYLDLACPNIFIGEDEKKARVTRAWREASLSAGESDAQMTQRMRAAIRRIRAQAATPILE